MSLKYSRKEIKAEAKSLGFFACGIVQATPVDAETAAAVRQWISKGSQATMDYMANYTEKRLNPCLLVPGTKTIVSLAMNYAPAKTMPTTEYQLAAYAYGQDYHDVMKTKLRQLATIIANKFDTDEVEKPTGEIRIFVDTAPVLERYWAQKAGLGWIGKNHQLIIPKAGSEAHITFLCCKRCFFAMSKPHFRFSSALFLQNAHHHLAKQKPYPTIQINHKYTNNTPQMGCQNITNKL